MIFVSEIVLDEHEWCFDKIRFNIDAKLYQYFVLLSNVMNNLMSSFTYFQQQNKFFLDLFDEGFI